jgi:hypothetical protein
MAGSSKKMPVSDEEVYKLLQENEYSTISVSKYSSDSEINVNILSCGELNVSCGEEENVSDNSSMQRGLWGKVRC